MASYAYQPPPNQQAYPAPNNLDFYQSSYPQQPVSPRSTPFQPAYGAAAQGNPYPSYGQGFGGAGGFGGGAAGVSGQMGSNTEGLTTGWLAAFATEGYPGEPPLLEELGVNFGHIRMKTIAVLNPLASMDQHIMDDADLAGPVLFCALFGTFLLLSGKLWFGYVLGLFSLGIGALHTIFSMMSPPLSQDEVHAARDTHGAYSAGGRLSSTLTLGRSGSVLGYCLLPLVWTSLLGVLLPLDTLLGYACVSLAIAWCTYSSSAMFCAVGRMTGMRGLVAYPLALFYVGFGIMAIFSSRGTGRLAEMKAAR